MCRGAIKHSKVFKLVSIVIICLMIFNDIAFSLDSSSIKRTHHTLSPLSRFIEGEGFIIDRGKTTSDLQEYLENNSSLVYISKLIGKALATAESAENLTETALKQLIKRHVKHLDEVNFDWEGLIKDENTFCLPLRTSASSNTHMLRYFLSSDFPQRLLPSNAVQIGAGDAYLIHEAVEEDFTNTVTVQIPVEREEAEGASAYGEEYDKWYGGLDDHIKENTFERLKMFLEKDKEVDEASYRYLLRAIYVYTGDTPRNDLVSIQQMVFDHAEEINVAQEMEIDQVVKAIYHSLYTLKREHSVIGKHETVGEQKARLTVLSVLAHREEHLEAIDIAIQDMKRIVPELTVIHGILAYYRRRVEEFFKELSKRALELERKRRKAEGNMYSGMVLGSLAASAFDPLLGISVLVFLGAIYASRNILPYLKAYRPGTVKEGFLLAFRKVKMDIDSLIGLPAAYGPQPEATSYGEKSEKLAVFFSAAKGKKGKKAKYGASVKGKKRTGVSKWDLLDTLKEKLPTLSEDILAQLEEANDIGKRRKILVKSGVEVAEAIDGKFLNQEIENFIKTHVKEKKEKPLDNFLRFTGQGRYLVAYESDDLDYIVKTYFQKDKKHQVLVDWIEEGYEIARSRLKGLAAETMVIDATGGVQNEFVYRLKGKGFQKTDIAIIQKKIHPLVEVMAIYALSGEEEKAKRLLDGYKEVVIAMFRRGVIDTDFGGTLANYGVDEKTGQICIFDFGDLSSGITQAYEFADYIETTNTYVEMGLRQFVSDEVADYFVENAFKESDFYDKDGKILFGADLKKKGLKEFKMDFSMAEEEARELFANHKLGENEERKGAKLFAVAPLVLLDNFALALSVIAAYGLIVYVSREVMPYLKANAPPTFKGALRLIKEKISHDINNLLDPVPIPVLQTAGTPEGALPLAHFSSSSIGGEGKEQKEKDGETYGEEFQDFLRFWDKHDPEITFERAEKMGEGKKLQDNPLRFLLWAIKKIYFYDLPTRCLNKIWTVVCIAHDEVDLEAKKKIYDAEDALHQQLNDLMDELELPIIHDFSSVGEKKARDIVLKVLSLRDEHLKAIDKTIYDVTSIAPDLEVAQDILKYYRKRVVEFFDELDSRVEKLGLKEEQKTAEAVELSEGKENKNKTVKNLPKPKIMNPISEEEKEKRRKARERLDRFKYAMQNAKYRNGNKVDLRGLPRGVVEVPEDLEIIIIGDLHERVDNLNAILFHRQGNIVDGKMVLEPSVVDKLERTERDEEGGTIVYINGDALHSENAAHPSSIEMEGSIVMMETLFALKTTFIDSFYWGLGDHDHPDINCEKIVLDPDTEEEVAIRQTELFEKKIKAEYGLMYFEEFTECMDHLPFRLLHPGIVANHAGPPKGEYQREDISGATGTQLKEVETTEKFHPSQFVWVRHESYPKELEPEATYTLKDAENYLDIIGLPKAIYLVSHSPGLMLHRGFFREIAPGHFVIYSAGDEPGYASYKNGKLRFFSTSSPEPVFTYDPARRREHFCREGFHFDSRRDHASQKTVVEETVRELAVKYSFSEEERGRLAKLADSLTSNMLSYGRSGTAAVAVFRQGDGRIAMELRSIDLGEGVENPEEKRKEGLKLLPEMETGFYRFSRYADETRIESFGRVWEKGEEGAFQDIGASLLDEGTLVELVVYKSAGETPDDAGRDTSPKSESKLSKLGKLASVLFHYLLPLTGIVIAGIILDSYVSGFIQGGLVLAVMVGMTVPVGREESYNFLGYGEAEELEEAAVNLVEFARQNKVKAVVGFHFAGTIGARFFMDVWKAMYPDEKLPELFLLGDAIRQDIGVLGAWNFEKNKRGAEKAVKELTIFPELKKNFNGVILLVDEAVGTGTTLRFVRLILQSVGAEKVLTSALLGKKGKIDGIDIVGKKTANWGEWPTWWRQKRNLIDLMSESPSSIGRKSEEDLLESIKARAATDLKKIVKSLKGRMQQKKRKKKGKKASASIAFLGIAAAIWGILVGVSYLAIGSGDMASEFKDAFFSLKGIVTGILTSFGFLVGSILKIPEEIIFDERDVRGYLRQMDSDNEFERLIALRELKNLPLEPEFLGSDELAREIIQALGRRLQYEESEDVLVSTLEMTEKISYIYPLEEFAERGVINLLLDRFTPLRVRKMALRVLGETRFRSPELMKDMAGALAKQFHITKDPKVHVLTIRALGNIIMFPLGDTEPVAREIFRFLEEVSERDVLEVRYGHENNPVVGRIPLDVTVREAAIVQVARIFQRSIKFAEAILYYNVKLIAPPWMSNSESLSNRCELFISLIRARRGAFYEYRLQIAAVKALRDIAYEWAWFTERNRDRSEIDRFGKVPEDLGRRLTGGVGRFLDENIPSTENEKKRVKLLASDILVNFGEKEEEKSKKVIEGVTPLVFDTDRKISSYARKILNDIARRYRDLTEDSTFKRIFSFCGLGGVEKNDSSRGGSYICLLVFMAGIMGWASIILTLGADLPARIEQMGLPVIIAELHSWVTNKVTIMSTLSLIGGMVMGMMFSPEEDPARKVIDCLEYYGGEATYEEINLWLAEYPEQKITRILKELAAGNKIEERGEGMSFALVSSGGMIVEDEEEDELGEKKVPTTARKKRSERTPEEAYIAEAKPLSAEEKEELKARVGGKNILFVSFRLNERKLDGVSLEANKWAEILDRLGANVHYYSGETVLPELSSGRKVQKPENDMSLAHYLNEKVIELTERAFLKRKLKKKQKDKARDELENGEIKQAIKQDLIKYLREAKIDYIVAENILAYPGNISLSMATLEAAEEVGIEIIAHSHDFWWERKRFRGADRKSKFLLDKMIPHGRFDIATCVINSLQQESLGEKLNVKNIQIAPNVMDFDNKPTLDEERIRKFREHFGIEEDDIFLLASVRPVERKRLEKTLAIAQEMYKAGQKPIKIVFTHTGASGDEKSNYEIVRPDGTTEKVTYWEWIKDKARKTPGVIIIDAGKEIAEEEGRANSFTLGEAYQASDAVIYTPDWEGWGNALGEAMYYSKPIIVTPYLVYTRDIKPKGARCIEVNPGLCWAKPYLQEKAAEIIKILSDSEKITEMVEHNYRIGQREFSYGNIEGVLLSAFKQLKKGELLPNDSPEKGGEDNRPDKSWGPGSPSATQPPDSGAIEEIKSRLEELRRKKWEEFTGEDREYLKSVAETFGFDAEEMDLVGAESVLDAYIEEFYILAEAKLESFGYRELPFYIDESIGKHWTRAFKHEFNYLAFDADFVQMELRKLADGEENEKAAQEMKALADIIERQGRENGIWAQILKKWNTIKVMNSGMAVALLEALMDNIKRSIEARTKAHGYVRENKENMHEEQFNMLDENMRHINRKCRFHYERLSSLRERVISDGDVKGFIDVNESIKEALEPYLGDKRIEVSTKLAENLPPVYANSFEVSYVWINLITNARDSILAMETIPDNARISVSTELIEENGRSYVKVVVRDNGEGIPEELVRKRKIFEEEFTTKDKGTGMGLYLIDRILSDIGGSIEVASSPRIKGEKDNLPGEEAGAEFDLSLPAVDKESDKFEALKQLDEESMKYAEGSAKELMGAFLLHQMETPEEGERRIFAFSTSWMEKYRTDPVQYNAINPILTAIRKYCESRGMPFVIAEDKELIEQIEQQRGEEGYENAKVVVLAGDQSILSGHLTSLKSDKNVFLAGINEHSVKEHGYKWIVEMVELAIKLSISREYTGRDTKIKWHPHENLKNCVIFDLPETLPVDWYDHSKVYRKQKEVLLAA